jgi:hypothetical protein
MNGQLIHCARRLLPAWVAGLAFFLLLANPASAQTARVPFEQGTHAFRFILNNLELRPLTDLNQLQEEAEKSILIVFGETQVLDAIPEGGLKAFLDKGGAVMVATDRADVQEWENVLQIGLRGYFVHAPRRSASAYKENEACPFIFPLPVENIDVFRNLSKVASNRPIYIVNHSADLKTIAVFPDDCYIKVAGEEIQLKSTQPRRRPAAFAAGGNFGKGRVLVLSDHSVFINEMMIQTDNDNFDFAYQCVDWLRGEGETKRTQVLLLDEGETITNFDVPVTDVPVPPIGVINQMLVKMEQENLFNKIVLGENLTERFPNILRGLVVALTTALAGFGCYRFLLARHVVDPKEPLFSAKVAKQAPDVALTVQRHSAMVKADNFWEAAHHLARDWFLANLPGSLPEPKTSSGKKGLPKSNQPAILEGVTVDAGWWRRRSWMKKLKGIWHIATGPPRRLPAPEFARFVTELEEVKAALARGAFHLKTKAD